MQGFFPTGLCVFLLVSVFISPFVVTVLSAQEPVTDTHASLWQRAKGRILRA